MKPIPISPHVLSTFPRRKDVKTAYDRASESVQKILALAENNGVAPSDISGGVLTIRPFYEGDGKKRARSFLVEGQLTLKVRDLAQLESILQNSVGDGIADFRSPTCSLSNEETAKQKAVAEAMQHSSDRANAALRPRGQKAGALRFVKVDVNQLSGFSEIILQDAGWTAEHFDAALPAKKPSPPPPPPFQQPKKITVNATVERAYQIL
jgi:uncharacterized protein YggE